MGAIRQWKLTLTPPSPKERIVLRKWIGLARSGRRAAGQRDNAGDIELASARACEITSCNLMVIVELNPGFPDGSSDVGDRISTPSLPVVIVRFNFADLIGVVG
jgi:hypothetical protein